MNTRCLARNIHDLGHTGLHAVGELIRGDSCLDLWILQDIETRLIEVPKDINVWRRRLRSMPGGFPTYSTGSPCERNVTP